MFLKYGSYSHALNEAEVVIQRDLTSGADGNVNLIKEVWTISGELFGASPSAITTAINDLQAAYSENGQDLALCFDDGSNSAHVLQSAGTKAGNQVKRLIFPQGKGSEYGTHRTYQIVVEAEIPVGPQEGAGVGSNSGGSSGAGTAQHQPSEGWASEWAETLTFSGGGPRFVFLNTLNGLPQRQLVNQATPYKAVQAGKATGLFTWPVAPPPYWPVHEQRDQRQISKTSPWEAARTGKFERTWQYVFSSATPFN